MFQVNVLESARNRVGDSVEAFECGGTYGVEVKFARGTGSCFYYPKDRLFERFEFMKQKYGVM